jgi:hypothetical protein
MAPLGPIAMSAGKKAALATLGMFTGVGGAVAFKLDQASLLLSVANFFGVLEEIKIWLMLFHLVRKNTKNTDQASRYLSILPCLLGFCICKMVYCSYAIARHLFRISTNVSMFFHYNFHLLHLII